MSTHAREAGSMPPSLAQEKGVEELLWWIARSTSPLVGEEFFRTLVSHLGTALGLTVVFVAECLDWPTSRVRTLACWNRTSLRENFEFDLRGTPCEETVCGQRVCSVPEGVHRLYPAEEGKDSHSYHGVPIFDAAHERVIGHIAFFDSKRMEQDVFSNPLFHIFAQRAAAELQRRQAQARADEHLQQLAHLSRVGAMGEMASLIAHEMNQPLASILTYTQACLRLVREEPKASPELVEAMRSAAAEAERAGAIIRHLRGFVRKGQAQAAEADVNALVAEAVGLAGMEARREQVRLVLEPARELPSARVDWVQIEQVVLNLVRNSIEALRDRGAGAREVLVRTAQLPLRRIEVSVHDSGPGVQPRLAERVFEPFYSTKPEGMGIGLAICRSIVENHGGRLWLDTGNGAGATFRFQLPAAPLAGKP
jgi:signal transduction histidine kinase